LLSKSGQLQFLPTVFIVLAMDQERHLAK